MQHPTDEEIASVLVAFMSDAFNRSIRALENAGAIDARRMRTAYAGVGSNYYDVVSEQIEITAKSAVPGIRQIFSAPNRDGGEQ